ncbi:MAG: SurA N-terminal domain-containing protein [Mariniphaga sp.]|nr:SurA N-terminal domain-containing protein [Mariniphaga sp.]
MATLQKIRNRAGLLVAIVIGLALVAFILGDMFRSGNTFFQRRQTEIADINGESFQYLDFQRKVQELGDIYELNSGESQIDEATWIQLREQTWQELVRDALMEDTYDDLGISVSTDELYDMVQGSNIHPIVQQIFQNQNTGQVDRGAIIRFLKNLELGATPQQREYWLYLEKQIVASRIQSKYNNLIKKGLYATNEEAQRSLDEKNSIISFNYIALPYTSVADSQVVVNENDLENYYNEHKEEYKQEGSRKIEYVVFPIDPSDQDNLDTEIWMNDIKSDFELAEDNIQFANSNSDESFDDTWLGLEELPANINYWISIQNAEINNLFGPYFENGSYKLAKYHASEMRPDSVEARHILIRVTASDPQDVIQSKVALADSLKTAVENGSNFAALAREFSEDEGSVVNGGELGLFAHAQMVKPFSDAAFNNKESEVSIAESQFGLHIIQTTRRVAEVRKYQIVYLNRVVAPSTETYQGIYAEVSKFASENTSQEDFNNAIVEQNLSKRTATVLENDRVIPGIENSRVIIRSAYDAKEGDILVDVRESSIFEIGDNFIIATLVDISEKGISNFDDVRARIELAVIREKKAEYLIDKASGVLNGENDIIVIAQELGSEVNTAQNINFSLVSIPNVGLEPAVIGTVASLEEGKISVPVKGNNSVYIVEVTETIVGTIANIASEQQSITQNIAYRADLQAYEAIKNAAEIEDRRSKFY